VSEPRNPDAERALLGAILFSNALLDRLPGLHAAHFSEPAHAALFTKIVETVRAGRTADGVSLRPWALETLGEHGAGFVLDIIANASPIDRYAVSYAEDLKRMSALRAVGHWCQQAAVSALEPDADPLEILGELEGALDPVKTFQDTDGTDTEEAGDAFLTALDRPTISTGFPSLDRRLGGFHRGDLIILAGRPSMGKTALAAQFARNVAAQGGGVHFASLEMAKEQLGRRMISAATFHSASELDRIPYTYLRHGMAYDMQRLRAIVAKLPKTFIIDDRAAQTLAQIEAGARATKRRVGRLDLVVVDYLQLCRSLRTDGRVHEVTEISQGLKGVAKRLNAPVLALCQLNRSVESREDKRPTLADARDSGAIEQDADVFLTVFREAYYLERKEEKHKSDEEYFRRGDIARDMEVTTHKQRQGAVGKDVLEAWLEFDTIIEKKGARP
jgi:replicative DNA helicase